MSAGGSDLAVGDGSPCSQTGTGSGTGTQCYQHACQRQDPLSIHPSSALPPPLPSFVLAFLAFSTSFSLIVCTLCCAHFFLVCFFIFCFDFSVPFLSPLRSPPTRGWKIPFMTLVLHVRKYNTNMHNAFTFSPPRHHHGSLRMILFFALLILWLLIAAVRMIRCSVHGMLFQVCAVVKAGAKEGNHKICIFITPEPQFLTSIRMCKPEC